jgi:hypothetical protein
LDKLRQHYLHKQLWVIWDVDLTMARHRVHSLLTRPVNW